MRGKLHIRAAEQGDISQLLELYLHLNPDNPSLSAADACAIFEQFSSLPNSFIFVGHAEGVLVTTCTLIVIPNLTRGGAPYALIENVVTHADHRRHGYGQAILQAAASSAWQSGCYKVMLMTGSKEPGTLKFYLDVGFEQTKTGFQLRRVAE